MGIEPSLTQLYFASQARSELRSSGTFLLSFGYIVITSTMHETSKTNRFRGSGFAQQFLNGAVLDIGCGEDIVCPWAQPFDLAHGDAQHISDFLPPSSYDTVHSSHCLEHMKDPPAALAQWWTLVKPGGYLILVVPHEDLYEQGIWPSRFNSDHKATFRLGGVSQFSPVSYDILELATALADAQVLSAEIQDFGYDRRLMATGIDLKKPQPFISLRFARRMLRAMTKPLPSMRHAVTVWIENLYFHRYGIPVDQTSRDALAQIQVILRKRAES